MTAVLFLFYRGAEPLEWGVENGGGMGIEVVSDKLVLREIVFTVCAMTPSV